MTIRWQYLLVSLVFILSACGDLATPAPTRVPTITPTKLSTPLPYVATAVPAGFSDDNPIQIVIVPADPTIATERLAEFESALQDLTDVTISVSLVETQEEAYAAVCDSQSGVVSAAWLEGMTYVANNFANCGVGFLQADTPDGTGRSGVLLQNVVPEDGEESGDDAQPLGQEEEEGLVTTIGQSFCRTGVDSLFGWSLPVLYYGAEGISAGEIVEIQEVADNDALIADLTAGDCIIGGMAESEFEAYLDADEDATLADAVEIIVESPEIPYNVFSFSVSLSLNAIIDIQNGLLQLEFQSGRGEPTAEATEDPDAPSVTIDSDLMTAFFGEGTLVPADESDFAELFDLFSATGIEFSELAN